ncbi:predicted protein [Naegleria gruberi]|uniref:Predicted protein n=1 Tax=Naegleria gruberi TaxID=5762 RepID=D2V7T4_NAEGR|nr:uncharacterized protein NAEGRDRAFT_64917 [Naegleria gruberi]EFC47058.1 predicted protein [Naegleria gruberi]|eukprot:XP_002679802.1 predicted protein [Naegleria gruberi strain NEG-M]
MSKFDKPAQQYIKDYLIQEEDVSEKNRKDDKIFSSLNERDKNNSVMLLSREEFKNGKPRKSELKYLEKSELRKALKLHGEEENIFNEDGGFNKQIGPRQLKNLHKAELEREEFLKMSRDVRRQKFKLMRVVENGYRSGVLNAEDDYGVFAKSSQQLKDKQNRAMVHTVTRKELLQSKANSDLGRVTLKPAEDSINISTNFNDSLMKRKGRTELNEKMHGKKDIILQNENNLQNVKRLEFIYHNQTRGKHYNIVSGEDYPIESFLVK